MNNSEAMVSFNRALYGTARRRTVFFKALTGILAFQMLFFGMAPVAWARTTALPDTATARNAAGDAIGTQPNYTVSGTTGTFTGAGTWTWGANTTGFNVNGATLVLDGSGTFKFIDQSGAGSDISGVVNGSGADFVLVNASGINFNGAQMNVASLVAAAMNSFAIGSTQYDGDDLKGTVSVSGGSLPESTVLLGKTVTGYSPNWTVVSAVPVGAKFTVPSGGTITFTGTTGAETVLHAEKVGMNGSSVGGGDVAATGADGITGNFTQSDGTITANGTAGIAGTLTQSGGLVTASKIAALNQTAAGAVANTAQITGNATVVGTLNGNGGLTVGSLTQNGGSVAANGALTINGAASQGGGTIAASGTSLNAGGANVSLNQAGNSLGTVAGNAGNVTLNGSSLAVGGLAASGTLTLQSAATAAGNVSANTIQATTLTQSSGTITTKEISGTVVQNGGTIQAANATEGLTFNNIITTQNGTLSGNGGNVTVANGSTLSGTVNANILNGNFTQAGGTITATTVAGTVTQNGSGTINATTLSGTVTQNGGTIQANDSTAGLTLSQAITTQNGTLSGNGGDVTLAGGDTLSGTVTAKNLTAGTGNITQAAGTITVDDTLTAGTFTQSGTTEKTASAATILADVSQTGAGTITATTSIGANGNEKTVSQSDAGTIKTDHVYGTVSQTGTGAAKLQANGATLVLEGYVVQNDANATIGTTDTSVTVKKAFTQTAGKIEADTLTLDNAANDATAQYAFGSANNNVAILTGTAKSVTINDSARTGKLTLSNLSLGTGDGNVVTVSKAAYVEIAGVAAKEIAVTEAGVLTDTSAQSDVATTVKFGDATHKVGDVTFDDTKELSVAGISSSGNVKIESETSLAQSGAIQSTYGDVAISTAAFTQGGNAISGKNVTILDSNAGGLIVNGNVTATGDILVEATGGKLTVGAATLEAKGTIPDETVSVGGGSVDHAFGNVVLRGKDVEINGTDASHKATLSAKTGVGVAATDLSGYDSLTETYAADKGTVTIGANADVVSPKVVVTAYGNLEIKEGTRMGVTSADAKDSDLTVFTENTLKMGLDATTRPTKNVRIASAKGMDADLTQEITLGQFAINAATLPELKFSEATERISIESVGDVKVTTKSDVTIFNNALDSGAGSVSAVNVANAANSPVTVEAGVSASKAAHGLVGKNVTLVAGGAVTVEDKAIVSSTDNKLVIDTTGVTTGTKLINVQAGSTVKSVKGVELKSGGALTVAGTVLDRDAAGDATGGGIALSSADGSDVTISGTVDAKGALTVASGKDENLSGTVKTGDALSITAKAGVNQTAGTVTANAAGKVSTLTAQNGGIALAQSGNDFDTVKATANGGSISLADMKDLTLSADGTTATGDGAGISIATGGKLTIAGAVSASDAITLVATDTLDTTGASNNDAEIDATAATATITANGGQAGATAQGNAAFGAEVKGASVELSATDGGTLSTKSVTATSGSATLQGASVTTAGSVTANGANSDALVTATAGAATMGGVVTAGRDATITATAGADTSAGAVTAARDATIAAGNSAAQVAAVTATAGNATISGTSVNNSGVVQAGGNAALIGGAGGTTVGANVTAGGNAVIIADGGVATINATVAAANLGVQGDAIANNGNYAGINQLALVQTGDQAVTLDDASIPAGAQVVGIQTAGDLTVNSAHALNFGNASVTAGGRTVAANGLASTAGAVDVTAAGDITSSAITGANGTTVTAQGQQVTVTGELGNGGVTQVTAGGLQSGTLAAGAGGATLDIGGAADVGQLNVGGDMNGTVGGQFTTTGGQVGSIGQNGGFQANGGFQQNGALGSGPVTVVAGNYQLNGPLNAGGAVNITAGGGIQGNGLLTAGALTLQGGGIGTVANPLTISSANLQQIAGNGIYLIDTAAGPIAINVINSQGDLALTIQNATVNGGGAITAGNNFTLTTNQRFGTLQNPVNVTFGGTLTINGANAPLLHIIIDGSANPNDLDIIYNANGFAIWGNAQEGYQIVGTSAENRRLLNRALAFSVNTPELKSAQGIFGNPAFLHTKMNVSEARPGANMDMMALQSVGLEETWTKIIDADLSGWNPTVDTTDVPLQPKMEALASEVMLQPEIQPARKPQKASDAGQLGQSRE